MDIFALDEVELDGLPDDEAPVAYDFSGTTLTNAPGFDLSGTTLSNELDLSGTTLEGA